MNPARTGTKAAEHYRLTVKAGECQVVQLRLSDAAPSGFTLQKGHPATVFATNFNQVMEARCREADEFNSVITPPSLGVEASMVM